MGKEIDLLAKYPKAKRDLKKRLKEKSEEDRRIARQFGKEFFDGDRRHGYGGFRYDPRFWGETVKDFRDYYNLAPDSAILDVGCAKGFMLYDLMRIMPEARLAGLDISEYAIENAKEEVREFLVVGDARKLPYDDDSFELVISINTVHNLERDDCKRALGEIMRVGSAHKFITVDAYRTDEDRERMLAWNLTAKTIMHIDEWKDFFEEADYDGDYYWFIP
jgi:SAM-dependent methyltransferase